MSARSNNRGAVPNTAGFTFVEVMVVVLIISVLVAIAIPMFLSTRDRATDRAVQANLRTGFANAKALYADDDSYTAVTPAALQASESSLRFISGVSTSPHILSVVSTDAFVVLAARSGSRSCFAIADSPQSAGTMFANLGTAACDASVAPALPASPPAAPTALPGGGWAKSW